VLIKVKSRFVRLTVVAVEKQFVLIILIDCTKKKGKVPRGGPSALHPIGLLYSDPEGVPSFISRDAAHRLVCSASASEGRNYVEGI
jgi:hypothetical protein